MIMLIPQPYLLGESLEGCSSLLHHLAQLAHGASERARLCCIDGVQAHGLELTPQCACMPQGHSFGMKLAT